MILVYDFVEATVLYWNSRVWLLLSSTPPAELANLSFHNTFDMGNITGLAHLIDHRYGPSDFVELIPQASAIEYISTISDDVL